MYIFIMLMSENNKTLILTYKKCKFGLIIYDIQVESYLLAFILNSIM